MLWRSCDIINETREIKGPNVEVFVGDGLPAALLHLAGLQGDVDTGVTR